MFPHVIPRPPHRALGRAALSRAAQGCTYRSVDHGQKLVTPGTAAGEPQSGIVSNYAKRMTSTAGRTYPGPHTYVQQVVRRTTC